LASSAVRSIIAWSHSMHLVTLRLNGDERPLAVEPRRTLLDALRVDLALTGTKKVCDMGDCGACTVLLDGRAVYSCLTLAVDCDDREVTTIEGLTHSDPAHGSDTAELDPVQRAFIEADAYQCGFCTPGQIMSITALLSEQRAPSEDEIRRAVSGNLCRCGAYQNIVRAGQRAAELYATTTQSTPSVGAPAVGAPSVGAPVGGRR
jgi:aerobic-type carbon monoxide dehydrogenase small subunit (CoxS/CutS family)